VEPPPTEPPAKPPPPTPPTPATRSVAFISKALAATRKGVVKLSLANPNRFSVTGTVKITARNGKNRILTLGTATFSIAGGKSFPVTIALSKASRKLLAGKARLSVLVALSTQGPAGGPVASQKRMVLSAPKPKGNYR
jgi:hypothetical protein